MSCVPGLSPCPPKAPGGSPFPAQSAVHAALLKRAEPLTPLHCMRGSGGRGPCVSPGHTTKPIPLTREEERRLPGAGKMQDHVTARLLQRVQAPASSAAARQGAGSPYPCLQHRQQPRLPCSREGGWHLVLPLGSQGPMPAAPLPTHIPCHPRLLPVGCGAAQPSPAVSERGRAGISH